MADLEARAVAKELLVASVVLVAKVARLLAAARAVSVAHRLKKPNPKPNPRAKNPLRTSPRKPFEALNRGSNHTGRPKAVPFSFCESSTPQRSFAAIS